MGDQPGAVAGRHPVGDLHPLRDVLADMIMLAVLGVVVLQIVICIIRYLAGIVRDVNRWDRW
jgi:hypothetical protein